MLASVGAAVGQGLLMKGGRYLEARESRTVRSGHGEVGTLGATGPRVRAQLRVQRRRRSTGAQWSEASWAGLKRPSGSSGANTRIVVSAVVFSVQAGLAWLPA